MAQDGVNGQMQMMVVTSLEEEWISLRAHLSKSYPPQSDVTSCSEEQKRAYELVTDDDRSMRLHCAVMNPDSTDEETIEGLDACFKATSAGIAIFILLIQDGQYTQREKRMMEILQANFGVEVFKFLVVLSVKGKSDDVTDFNDGLLELINVCGGRFCRITGRSQSDEMSALFEMIEYTMSESGSRGYTQDIEAHRRNTEDAAMKILNNKLREAEERERAFLQLIAQHEENRARETEELRSKHGEERKREVEEKRTYGERRERCEEALRSHKTLLQMQVKPDDEDAKQTSVILLGMSGSGKTSARNIILDRASNRFTVGASCPSEAPSATLACERREVRQKDGSRLVLVDTPELWDEDGVENLELVKDCLALAQPGPHAFVLVVQVGRFTQGESEMLWYLQKTFGRDVAERTVVLLTRCGDDGGGRHRGGGVAGGDIDGFVADAHSSLRELIRKCGSRYYALNVRGFQNVLGFSQVKELVSGVNKLVASHGGESCAKRFSVEELKERMKMIEER